MGRRTSKEFTMFPLSKPFGYHPVIVEEKIKDYENTIKQLNDALVSKNQTINSLETRLEHALSELRNLHLEMSNLELPDTTEMLEHQILDDFSRYNSGGSNNVVIEPPEPLGKPKHNNITLKRQSINIPHDIEGFDNDVNNDDSNLFTIVN